MRIELTENHKEIAELLMHPDIIEGITNDECDTLNIESMETGIKELLPLSLYMRVLADSDEVVGMLSFHDEEDALDIHCAFLKGFRGTFAIEAINKAIDMVFTHTKYEKILARFSSNRLSILKMASYLGFKLDHLVEKDYPDNGVMYDTICMTLIKKDYKHA